MPSKAASSTRPAHRQRPAWASRPRRPVGLLFLNLPLAFILLYAFSTDDRSFTFPPPGLTLSWFAVAWGARTSGRRSAFRCAWPCGNGDRAGAGHAGGVAMFRFRFFGKEAITLLILLPIALPGIVTGISLRSAFGFVDIPFSYWTIVLGHATFCIVVVYNNVIARLRRSSPALIEASMDLGANASRPSAM